MPAYGNAPGNAGLLAQAPRQITASVVNNILNLPGDAAKFDVLVSTAGTVYTVNWAGNPVGAEIILLCRSASTQALSFDGSGSPSNLANSSTPITFNSKDTLVLRCAADGKWYPAHSAVA